jgi:ADP-ribose pyrophosphatase YjhB (NUDIX family)
MRKSYGRCGDYLATAARPAHAQLSRGSIRGATGLCSERQIRAAAAMNYPVSVKGVMLEAGRVVLLENERGEWELPGGRLEPGEAPEACLAREFAEEVGVEVTVKAILDSWVYEVLPQRHVAIVTYGVARLGQGRLRVSGEHRRLGLFALGEIDALPMPEGYRRSIRAWATQAGAEPGWLPIARELQAMAQTGLFYSQDKYDSQRYGRLRSLATELMALGGGTTAAQIADLFCQDTGYATPRVDVRGAAFRDGRVLLVRERNDGRWSLPGGWADVNQTAGECIIREIEEESGFSARPVKLCAVWDRRRHGHTPPHPFYVYKIFFLCELTGGAARPSIETSEIGFFAEDELPELSPGRVQPAQIHRMFDHWRHPELPADFD